MNFRVAILLISSAMWGQTPKFEAAAIHPNRSGSSNTQISVSGARLVIMNASAKTLIRNAWDLLSFQVTGGPAWLDTDMFDITATTGQHDQLPPNELRLLLRSLLDERFGLRVHFEDRPGSIYALLPGKNGSRLALANSASVPGINTSKGAGAAKMRGTGQPVAVLASNLANQLGRYVRDDTGLTGQYDWVLQWAPDPSPDSSLPSLLTAVQEQLGLRLAPIKAAFPVLVVDHAEHPSAN